MAYDPVIPPVISLKGTVRALTFIMPGVSKAYYAYEEVVSSESNELFARVNYNPRDGEVRFVSLDDNGHDVLPSSRSLKETTLPAREIRRLKNTLERFHECALDNSVREDVRSFFRQFKIPSPKEMPEAYRIVGRFRKRLVVCWGYETVDGSSILPLTKIAEDHKNEWKEEFEQRKQILTLFRDWRKILRNFSIALVLFAAAAYICVFAPKRCHHGEIIGHGLDGRFFVQECPHVCPLPNCGKHLEPDMSCPSCRCKICGAQRRLDAAGICADPPDEEKCTATRGSEKAHRCGRHCKPAKSGKEPRCSECSASEL